MKQIIVADDDPGIRDVFGILFKRLLYNVTIYPNGEPLLRNEFKLPDLFILDKQLSGIDGLEVCRFLKGQQSTKNIPVIIISASPYIAKMATEVGADGFLEKPFKTKELIALMKKYLDNVDA